MVIWIAMIISGYVVKILYCCYNIKDAHIVRFPNVLHSSITAIEQVDEHHFFIATETGVRYVKLENGILETMPVEHWTIFMHR